MELIMAKKVSLRNKVLKILGSSSQPKKLADIVAKVGPSNLPLPKQNNRVSTELWKLKKSGFIEATPNGYLLTGVNKSVEVVSPVDSVEPVEPVEPVESNELINLRKAVRTKIETIDKLEVKLGELEHKNFVSNVIIKYLESRLNMLTGQQAVRNVRNADS
jgi:hypothetical protein